MMDDTTTLEAGQTLNVTLQMNGAEHDGELTVTSISSTYAAYVKNGNGDKFSLNFTSSKMQSAEKDTPTLMQHGNALADVVNLEVA